MGQGVLRYKTVLVVKREHKRLMISKLFNLGRDSTGSERGTARRKKELKAEKAEQEVWCAEPKKPGVS